MVPMLQRREGLLCEELIEEHLTKVFSYRKQHVGFFFFLIFGCAVWHAGS